MNNQNKTQSMHKRKRFRSRGIALSLLLLAVIFLSAQISPIQAAEEVVRTTVSGCYQNSGSKFTVSALIDWDIAGDLTVSLDGGAQTIPIGETYTLTYNGNSTALNTITLQEIAFELDADGSTGHTIEVYYDADPSTIIASTTFDAPPPCEPVSCTDGSDLGGMVFNDYDLNGVRSASETVGVENITVTAIEMDGTLSTTQTDYLGGYAFSGLTYPVRVEFSNIPAIYNGSSTVAGTDNGTTVQFAAGADCSVDLGVIDPADSCQGNPLVMTSCFVNGDNLFNDPDVADADEAFVLDTLVGFPYDLAGAKDTSQMTELAVAGETGTTFGLAYDKYTQQLYSSAVLRRHAGVGPLGLGGIYVTDMSSHILNDATTVTTTNLIDVTTLGLNVGTIDSNADRGLSSDPTVGTTDAQAFPAVGTVGIGDIDIDDLNSLLYFTNLNSKTLVVMDTAGTAATEYAVPDPGCVGGDLRPWAVKYHKGEVFVGVICDAQTSQDVEDLKAAIFVFDPVTATFNTTPVFDFPLTYPKGWVLGNKISATGWYPWSNDWDTHFSITGDDRAIYPTPMLADIEFDIDGSMVLSLLDRTSYQFGNNNADLVDPPEAKYTNVAGGDILRAYFSNGSYILENNGKAGPAVGSGANNSQGPGLGEFYNDNFLKNGVNAHAENVVGGLALLPGSGQVAVVTMDPLDGTARSGGVRYIDNMTGVPDHAYNVYSQAGSDTGPTFNKSAGLGDLELLCELPEALEIGNRVWFDTDGDGVQDPDEAPIAGATVNLYDASGTLIATAITDADGNYLFDTADGLLPNTAYTIRMDNPADYAAGGVLEDSILTVNDNGSNDLHDNDGTLVNGYPEIDVTTGSYNENDHTLDFGFTPAVEIGNYVWVEDDTDGDSSTGATTPVVGTVVTAIGADGTVYTATTDINGQYTITVPANSTYTVTVATPPNTDPSGTLITSSSDPADPDGMSHDGSGTTVTVGDENNYTIDFGFTPVVEIGNYVWIEDDTDGDSSTGTTTPVVGTVVTAIGTDGTVYTATTDANGQYTITVPANDTYTLTVATPADTNPSGTLITSSSDPADPDGMSHDGSGTTVTVGTENNYTIDFGFTPEVVEIGNYVWIEDDTDGDSSTGTTTPVVGTVVTATGADGTVYTATTDANGQYTITVPANGTYTLTVATPADTDPSGTLITSSSDPADPDGMSHDGSGTTVTVGTENNYTIDFGFTPELVEIGNYVWIEDDTDGDSSTGTTTPVVGTVVTAIGADGTVYTATTDANGQYTITVPANGTYTLTVATPAGTDPSGTLITSSSDPADPDGMSHDGSGTTVTVGEENNYTIDFGFTPEVVEIGNYIWIEDDTDGDSSTGTTTPVVGTVVTAIGADGTVYTATTDANGQYTITVPANSTYTLTVATPADTDPSGTLITSSSDPADPDGMSHDGSGTTVTVGTENNYTIDFGFTPLGSIGDTVWMDLDGDGTISGSETGISGVVVELTMPDGTVITTTTDSSGNYLFPDLPYGTYDVTIDVDTLPTDVVQTFDNDGGLDNTSTTTIDATTPDDLDQDFGYQPELGSIGDTVWMDLDGDGTINGSETGISGVVVELTMPDGTVITTTTDSSGNYLFPDLPYGTYDVTIDVDTLPTDVVQTFDNDGGLDNTSTTTIDATTPDDLDQDFGYQPELGSIGDTVWFDVNNDGVQDNDETGFSDVVVMLELPDGSVITTTTAADGTYLFSDLPAGTYIVTVDVSTLPAPYTQSYDADGTASANQSTYTLGSGEDNTTQDFGYSPESTSVSLRGVGSDGSSSAVGWIVGISALVMLALGAGVAVKRMGRVDA